MFFFILDLAENKPAQKNPTGYVLIKEYPNSKKIGYFEPYTTGEYSKHPEYWKPVFDDEVLKTEDNEFVFKNQNVFAVHKDKLAIENCAINIIESTTFCHKNYVFFARIENAQKYINFRKPIFSLLDLENLVGIDDLRWSTRYWLRVKNSVINVLYKSKFSK